MLATLSAGTMSSLTAESIWATMRADGMRKDPWFGEHGGTINIISGPRIAETRSQIVDTFLREAAFARAEWLLMVDADMVFTPGDVFDLLEVADPDTHPIVGGLCFAGNLGTMYPTIYVASRDADGKLDLDRVEDYPRDAIVKCHATGGAFLVVHRRVLLAMAKAFRTLDDGTPNPYPWFVEGHTDVHGRPYGEDIAFCMRAGALGFPVHVHTGVKVGHHKSIVLTEELFDA